MPHHSSQHQATPWNSLKVVVATVVKLPVGGDGLACHLIERNILRRESGRGGNHHGVPQPVGIIQAPLQGLHAAEGAANNRRPALNTKPVGQQCLALDPVAHGDDRKLRAEGLSGFRVDTVWPCAAVTAAQIVQADNEKTVGIDRFAWANATVPPARFPVVSGMIAGGMMVATQGMADKNGVAGIGIQGAVGFHDQVIVFQGLTTGQIDGSVEMIGLRGDNPDRIRRQGIRHRRDWFLVRSVSVWKCNGKAIASPAV